jgi:hypothetical protein
MTAKSVPPSEILENKGRVSRIAARIWNTLVGDIPISPSRYGNSSTMVETRNSLHAVSQPRARREGHTVVADSHVDRSSSSHHSDGAAVLPEVASPPHRQTKSTSGAHRKEPPGLASLSPTLLPKTRRYADRLNNHNIYSLAVFESGDNVVSSAVPPRMPAAGGPNSDMDGRDWKKATASFLSSSSSSSNSAGDGHSRAVPKVRRWSEMQAEDGTFEGSGVHRHHHHHHHHSDVHRRGGSSSHGRGQATLKERGGESKAVARNLATEAARRLPPGKRPRGRPPGSGRASAARHAKLEQHLAEEERRRMLAVSGGGMAGDAPALASDAVYVRPMLNQVNQKKQAVVNQLETYEKTLPNYDHGRSVADAHAMLNGEQLKSIRPRPIDIEKPLLVVWGNDKSFSDYEGIEDLPASSNARVYTRLSQIQTPIFSVDAAWDAAQPTFHRTNRLLTTDEEVTVDSLDEMLWYECDDKDAQWVRSLCSGTFLAKEDDVEKIVDRLEKEMAMMKRNMLGNVYLDLHGISLPNMTRAVAQKRDRVLRKAGMTSLSVHLLREFDNSVEDCTVCSNGTFTSDNQIVFCDGPGCDVVVHQHCYGITAVPRGSWLCARCSAGMQHVRCVLCPCSGGAMKQTLSGEWIHLVCALTSPAATVAYSAAHSITIRLNGNLIQRLKDIDIPKLPETSTTSTTAAAAGKKIKLEVPPTESSSSRASSSIPTAASSLLQSPSREKEKDSQPSPELVASCYLCEQTEGCAVRCSFHGCNRLFHPLCAVQRGLPLQESKGKSDTLRQLFCHEHTRSIPGKVKEVFAELEIAREFETVQTRLAFERTQMVLKHVLMPPWLIAAVYHHWVLRTHSRGSLMSCFDRALETILEEDQSSTGGRRRKCDENDLTRALRHDMERARMLVELVRKREKLKKSLMRAQLRILDRKLRDAETGVFLDWSTMEGEPRLSQHDLAVSASLMPGGQSGRLLHPHKSLPSSSSVSSARAGSLLTPQPAGVTAVTGRGRPKNTSVSPGKRPRGRPRKHPLPDDASHSPGKQVTHANVLHGVNLKRTGK